MEQVEIHFFHGFLGDSQDFKETVSLLPDSCFCVFHDLLEDCENIDFSKEAFSQWVFFKQKQLQESKNKKILVGYSLGGRLLMHLSPFLYEKAIIIASHPGLEKGREQRGLSDQKWACSLLKSDFNDWLKGWNSQEVFMYDKNRPQRRLTEFNKKKWSDILLGFSLSKQIPVDKKLSLHKQKFFWIYGEKDLKFKALKKRMSSLIGPDHIFAVKGAGHGVLFDEPLKLAEQIKRVL